MKPAPFRYARPATAAEAVAILAASPGGAKLLAGGQSLVPLLNMRLVRPAGSCWVRWFATPTSRDRPWYASELARTAYADVLGLPPGEEPGLEAHHIHQNPLARPVDAQRRVRSQLVFANAAHCCLVEVDRRTARSRCASTWWSTTAGAS
jgi:hypothetical protein